MMRARRRAIFVDVSETVLTGSNTGIQRVVRRIVAEGGQPAAAQGYDWVPVVATAGGLRGLSPVGLAALLTPQADAGAAAPAASPASGGVARILKKALALALALAPGVYETIRTRKLDQAYGKLIAPDPIAVGHDDIYLILDSFWLRSAAPRSAERLRRRGRVVVAVIYDVLALTHPHFFVGELPALLERQFRRMATAGTRFVSISADAAAQVRAALPARLRHEVRHFALGHDLQPGRASHAPAPPADPPTFLVVGTLEPRKNHRVVLDAFERLWATGWPGVLLIVGKPGWGVDALLERIAAHPERGQRLLVEHAASDTRLAAAYRSATATIMASFAEGFGLPIIESLAAGVPVIASDIAVFREILGDDPLLFDPHDPDQLAARVRAVSTDPAPCRRRAEAFGWPDWRASATALIGHVVAQARAQDGPRGTSGDPASIS